MRIAITGSRSLPPDSLTFLTLKLDRLIAKINRHRLIVLTRMVEGPVHEWAFRSMIAHMIFHEESDKEMLEGAKAIIVISGPKRVKDTVGLILEAKQQRIKIKTVEWKDKR